MSAVIAFIMTNASADSTKTLFLYDTLDTDSRFFIETFRDAFKEANIDIKEGAVAEKQAIDFSDVTDIVLYSRVMAFDMKSPLRKWVTEQKTFEGKRLYLYVTANRWFYEKHFDKFLNLIKDRNGTLVDAVTTATSKLTDDQKRGQVRTFIMKIAK